MGVPAVSTWYAKSFDKVCDNELFELLTKLDLFVKDGIIQKLYLALHCKTAILDPVM